MTNDVAASPFASSCFPFRIADIGNDAVVTPQKLKQHARAAAHARYMELPEVIGGEGGHQQLVAFRKADAAAQPKLATCSAATYLREDPATIVKLRARLRFRRAYLRQLRHKYFGAADPASSP